MGDINNLDVTKLELRLQIAGDVYIKHQPTPVKLADLDDMVSAMAAEILMDVAEDYPE